VLQAADSPQAELRRKPKPGKDEAASRAATVTTPAEAVDALLDWEDAALEAADRYRNWLLLNLAGFWKAFRLSDKGNAEIKKIEGGLAETVTTAVAAELGKAGIEAAASEAAAATLSSAFLSTRSAKALGGVLGFAVGLFIDWLIDELLAKDEKIFSYGVDVGLEVALKVDTIVNKSTRAIRTFGRSVSSSIFDAKTKPAELSATTKSLGASAASFRSLFVNPKDRSLYYKLMLMNELFPSNQSLAANTAPMESIPGAGEKVAFTIRNDVADKGPIRKVPSDGSTVVVGIHSFFCDLDEGLAPWHPSQGNPAVSTPPDHFWVDLEAVGSTPATKYPERLFHVVSADTGVGKFGIEEYATWYNVAKGDYRLVITRWAARHPIGLCGVGEFKVSAPAAPKGK